MFQHIKEGTPKKQPFACIKHKLKIITHFYLNNKSQLMLQSLPIKALVPYMDL